MNCKSLILAAALGLTLQTVQASDIKLVDGIAAVAGTEAITHRDVRQGMAEARRNLPKGSQISDQELRQQVLRQLIDQSLIVQAGKRRNISAGDAEIDEALARIAQSRKTTIDGLYAQSAKIGIGKAAVRRSVADSIIAQKVQQQAIMQNSRVSDAEIDNLIAQAKQQGLSLPEGRPMRQYRAQHILLKAESSNAAAAAESSIRKIHNQARSGHDFAALARQFSQDGSAAAGGDLGWFGEGYMVPEFESAVKALKPGQVSRPVRTQFGWHVIKLNEVRDAGSPEERQREAVRQYIAQQKIEQATAGLLQELRTNSFVEIRR
ncbi:MULTISPECIES: peptidylprolyl isomerase [unclassified Neisseria]|uniref:peptidylprolyl isomerase n=1 Tax=unclassified Neisseria TaxID=2623750 RepID=UPI002665277A|nr:MULTISPECIES: peptidylprolyl isomerase [unclassified Neisseria]MDO1510100.1 peptidylprolyl isomerase [Neisseria sp. MVDL19-042950]MDO1516870.1 peptidylprolyl isomerase [Neisseria sp. MVDL18-041461]MDO1564155.1 peptidylprolyl isomerase [Neisseria sp. MVDL20-010259]